MKTKSELKKVSMNLSSKSIANIEELSDLTHETNKTRVVASALEIAKYIVKKAKEEGSKIVIKDADGNTQELKLLI